MNEKLVMIDISEIYPNKDNPRKDIGDIKELTKSIKKNGLMQNLTVVPGHWENELAYTNGYTLLIGHRRYAAAKAAGLTEVPCRIISGMDKKEQVSTMLEENMQRADLTVYEQAEGFQMMMDLGSTEQDIADKTGFSKRTIQHRLNIAKLDKDVLREKEEDTAFQLSITDLIELEKIKNVETRNKVLKLSSSSRDMVVRAHDAVREEEYEARCNEVIAWCETIGLEEAPDEVKDMSWKHPTVITINLNNELPRLSELEDKIKPDYVYMKQYRCVVIKRIAEEDEQDGEQIERDKERERLNENRSKVQSIAKGTYSRICFLVLEIIEGKIADVEHTLELANEMFDILMDYTCQPSKDTIVNFLLEYDDSIGDDKQEATNKVNDMPLIHRLLILLAERVERFDNIIHWDNTWAENESKKFTRIFDIFKKWGFSLKPAEQFILDGTSDFYEVDDE